MEFFKDVKGFERLYQVSDLGNVKSLITNRILKPSSDKNGYRRVVLCNLGKKTYIKVHRLVAINFIENPNSKPVVNHINGVKTDNRIINLEWNTIAENTQHSYDNGLQVSPMKGKLGSENPNSTKITQKDKTGNIVNIFGSIREAGRKTGFDSSGLSKATRGIYKTYQGFIWEVSK